ncbi:MAG: hypothetical protein Q9202_006632 [Teloschistes flavicans]
MYTIVDEEVYRRNELKDYENATAIIAVPTQELKDLRIRDMHGQSMRLGKFEARCRASNFSSTTHLSLGCDSND